MFSGEEGGVILFIKECGKWSQCSFSIYLFLIVCSGVAWGGLLGGYRRSSEVAWLVHASFGGGGRLLTFQRSREAKPEGKESDLAAPEPQRLFLDKRVGRFKSGPLEPHSGFAIQVHPPFMFMVVRFTGTLTEVSLFSMSSWTAYSASPSLTSLSPTIVPFRRMLLPIGALGFAEFCCGSRLSSWRGWCLTMVMWSPTASLL